jgi:hypothetical protein
MADKEGKRKAGFFPKLLGTVVWGTILMVALRFNLPESVVGIERPPLATFFLFGACWPLVWGLFAMLRLFLPMPFELAPRFVELLLVSPGHLMAWVVFGKPSLEEDDAKKDAKKDESKSKD